MEKELNRQKKGEHTKFFFYWRKKRRVSDTEEEGRQGVLGACGLIYSGESIICGCFVKQIFLLWENLTNAHVCTVLL